MRELVTGAASSRPTTVGRKKATTWSGSLHVRGQRLAVEVRGENPSLLLVNGVGGGRSMWSCLRTALPSGTGTITFDAPGCSGSEPARSPLTVADQAALAAGVVAALGLAEVDVLGFSFGGMVAQQLARDHPDLVRRLVLISTGYGLGSWPGSAPALTLLALPHLLASRAGLESLGRHVFGGDPPGRSGTDRLRALAGFTAHPGSYAGQLLAGAAWSSLPWLGLLRHRALVLAGDRDPLVPLCNAETMAALMRRAQLRVVRGGGHLLVVDRADEVAGVVTDFLDVA